MESATTIASFSVTLRWVSFLRSLAKVLTKVMQQSTHRGGCLPISWGSLTCWRTDFHQAFLIYSISEPESIPFSLKSEILSYMLHSSKAYRIPYLVSPFRTVF